MLGGRKKQKISNIDTLVGLNTTVTGDIEFEGGLHVDGLIKGNLKAEDTSQSILSVSEQGCIEGTVTVPQVVLNGTVKGDVIARGRVELGTNARVIGNVYYNLIEMAIGAEVNGKLVHEPATRPPLLTQQSPPKEPPSDGQ